MKRALIVLVSMLSACAPSRPATPGPITGTRVVGYLAGWGVQTKGTRIADLPGENLTHINYAFALISDDGRMVPRDPCIDVGDCAGDSSDRPVSSGGNFAQLRALKTRHPHLKILVAVGGWTGSGKFSDIALTEESRRRFVSSGIETFMRRWPGLIDGFDIDWEYPTTGGLATNVRRPEDRRNFTLLLGELRQQLDAEGARDGKRYLLTAATAAGAWALRTMEVDSVTALLDWYNVMTYDYHSGSKTTHFNSPLHPAPNDATPALTIDSTVTIYQRAGIPPEKILVGIPFYGRGYSGVPAVDNGLFQPATGPAPQDWGASGIDYARLMARKPTEQGFVRHWSAEAQVPWLFNAETGVWIGYEDPQSVRAKAAFARSQKLGGVMIWELGGDDGSLLAAIRAGLRD
jgi:chitinase